MIMKNLLLTVLITLSTTIFAKTPDSLFGVYINDNVLNYVTKEELKSKVKSIIARGFDELTLNNPPVSNKNYSDKLFLLFDKNNKIGRIHSQKVFQNSETCEIVEYGLRRALENKYNIVFVRNPNAKYGFQKWVGDNVIATECFFHNNETFLLIFIETDEFRVKYSEYVDSTI